MGRYSLDEKATFGSALILLAAGFYFLFDYGSQVNQWAGKNRVPIGYVISSKQPVFENEILETVKDSSKAVVIGGMRLDLKGQTRLSVKLQNNRFNINVESGKFEMHLPPSANVKLNTKAKSMNLASVNGGRFVAQLPHGGDLQIQNVAGDILVRTPGAKQFHLPKAKYVVVQNYGDINIAAILPPQLISPREDARVFALGQQAQVLIELGATNGTFEYLIVDRKKNFTAKGSASGEKIKVALFEGNYEVSVRTVRGVNVSPWSEPRGFTVWARSRNLATAF